MGFVANHDLNMGVSGEIFPNNQSNEPMVSGTRILGNLHIA
jgi:hypothetical protein